MSIIEKATYSPEDNKLRLYPVTRLDSELYQRVKAAGYIWAPNQKIFVAPMWTPEREDIALELAGEIQDEDMTLEERAEERAERFENYSEKRENEGERTQTAVSAIADNIPLGQPILVGHHSEKKARKDAERIRNGMNKAINLFETAEYWKRRARGAIRHAKYKELPEVRARRIGTLEAALRKQQRIVETAQKFSDAWQKEGLTLARAKAIANFDHVSQCFTLAQYPRGNDASQYEGNMSLCSALDGIITAEQARDIAVSHHNATIAACQRWISHYENRIAYEKELLDASGWKAPEKKRSVKATLPLLNIRGTVSYKHRYRNETITCETHAMTKEEFSKISKDCVGTETSADGTHRMRCAILPGGNYTYGGKRVIVFLSDSKEHERPSQGDIDKAREEQEDREEKLMQKALADAGERAVRDAKLAPVREETAQRMAKIEQLKNAVNNGITIAVAPQLFPTPSAIVDEMIAMADIQPCMTVLEPSAGTGNIVRAIKNKEPTAHIDMIEIDSQLCKGLEVLAEDRSNVACADFLTCSPPFCPDSEQGFDRILMNPPFKDGIDIAHIKHALTFLKLGGRLVGICADGPRENEQLKPLCSTWEKLPEGSFKSQGTNVKTVLLTIDKE